MPLLAAAVCPHPPILVPQLAAGAAGEVADLLTACDTTVRALVQTPLDRLVVVGTGPSTALLTPPYQGDFQPWGIALPVGAPQPGRSAGDAPTAVPACAGSGLPLSLLMAAWLLERAGLVADGGPQRPVVEFRTAAADLAPDDCAVLGGQLAAGPERVGLLAMGDGSACRGEKAPGYADERAEAFDRTVADAIAAADPAPLRALDPVVAAELLVTGRAPWQVLAGAAATDVGPWRARLRYARAPYGVAYLVASWERG